MRRAHGLFLVVLLAACGQFGPNAATPTPPPAPTGTATPVVVIQTSPPLTLATAAPTTETRPPTPTALVEGLNVRLATPDPNPNCPDHYPWFFENPAPECAAVIHNTWTVLQPFEHGLMVWSQNRGETWVLLDDGSPFKPYQLVSDPLGLPLPAPDLAIVPPEGLYQPELGFALYWRALVPGTEWVRAQLGWATAPETAYSAFWQCNTAAGDAQRCYFNGPHDEIIVMTTGSALYWNYVQRAVR